MQMKKCARSAQGQVRSNQAPVGTPLQGEVFFCEKMFCFSGNCLQLMQSNLSDLFDFVNKRTTNEKHRFPPQRLAPAKSSGEGSYWILPQGDYMTLLRSDWLVILILDWTEC